MSLIDLKTHNFQSHNSQIYDFKTYIANQLLHKKLHFKCSCIISFDIIGEIVDYEIKNNLVYLRNVCESVQKRTGQKIDKVKSFIIDNFEKYFS